jgi:type III pantothenate kinase|tara:strand:+ start:136 stop:858 length:723 start_codon:yes stop_codon:yes gene_type:complete
MNLVIDIGNTYFKSAVFSNNDVLGFQHDKNKNFESFILKILKSHPKIKKTIVSNVSEINHELFFKKYKMDFLNVSGELNLPFENLYETPKTLGSDRIALISSAVFEYPCRNSLIIDAGTCLTIDMVNDRNQYCGGMISPGINLRYQSLYKMTSNLPLVGKSEKYSFPAKNTVGCIHSGVIGGIVNEINGFIDEVEGNNKKINIILTGGDANFLSKPLKIPIFADPIFILKGLNHILALNI